ncbi:alpha-mannosidase [candidate division KSB1 bacterium]
MLILLILFFTGGLSAQELYVKDWLMLDPFENENVETRLIKDYLNIENIHFPLGGEETAGRRWFVYHSEHNYLDFLNEELNYSLKTNGSVYTCFYLESDSERELKLYIGSDDGIAVFINDKLVLLNDIYRGHTFDEDEIIVNLKRGINRVLCKVSNGTGDWKLSVKLSDATGIRQLLDPEVLLNSKNITPADFEVRSQKWADADSIDEEGNFKTSLVLNVFNAGMQAVNSAVVVIQSESKILASANIGNIFGGEIKSVNLGINLIDLFELAVKTEKIKAILSYQDISRSFDIDLIPHFKLLKAAFSKWIFREWKRSISGNSVVFKKTILQPDFFSGFIQNLYFHLDTNVSAEVYVNGMNLKNFSGYSDKIVLSDDLRAEKRLNIELRADQSELASNTMPSGVFELEHLSVEKYIESDAYAKKLYDMDISENQKVDSNLVKAIYNKEIKKIPVILDKTINTIENLHLNAKNLKIHLIGNAHIDLAWLWRYPETIEVAKNTFEQALKNMELFPDFKFSQSQAHLYYWMEEKYPALFERIKAKVKEGSWEIVGGMWAEPDVNMPSGESLARQFLYGKRYFMEKFGVNVKTGYLPDTFGHPETLPMILKNSGIDYFLYFRPTEVPSVFNWQAPDSSTVLTSRPQEWYNRPVSDVIGKIAVDFSKETGAKNILRFYGVGDHGGGPTLKDIATLKKLDSVYVYPSLKFSRLDNYFEELEKEEINLPVVNDELNFVFRGCWTSQANVKKWNRRGEYLLPAAETFSYFASRLNGNYPKEEFKEAWRNILFNQFHDILPGSGIGEVYIDAEKMYEDAFKIAEEKLRTAVNTISENAATVPNSMDFHVPVMVFNSLNWERTVPVEVEVEMPGSELIVVDKKGKVMQTQVLDSFEKDGGLTKRILFIAENIPSVGYKTFYVKRGDSKNIKTSLKIGKHSIENSYFRVKIDPETGRFTSFYDKRNFREIFPEGAEGNIIKLLEDKPASMDAWVINLTGKEYPIKDKCRIEVIENGALRGKLRITRESGNSLFVQELAAFNNISYLTLNNYVKWNEQNTMMKLTFPTEFKTDVTAYEIPFGWTMRNNTGEEYPSQKCIDISDRNSGLAVLNDSKYGFSVDSAGTIGVTCLRSPNSPDPKADIGEHRFSIALYPHRNGITRGGVIRKGFEFNTVTPVKLPGMHLGSLPSDNSFIRVFNKNIIISAIKESEDGKNLLLRFYETGGQQTDTSIELFKDFSKVFETDFIEWDKKQIIGNSTGLNLRIRPFSVKTVLVQF